MEDEGPSAPAAANARPLPSRPRVVFTVLALIMALAAGLRLYNLGGLPAGFFCDEAALGYNAYSILETGRDETGAFLPLYVWSFDVSYKNPVFIYSAIVPVAVFGLTEAAVRFTAAAYGIATVLATFFLGNALMGPVVGLLGAAFLAVCPWHLHFSRIGFELVTFPFFFMLGLTCLVRWTQGRRRLELAMALFGTTLYTYAIAKLFVPLFLAGFVLLYHRELLRRRRESLAAFVVLAVTAAPVVIFDLHHADRASAYFQETAIFNLGRDPVGLVRRFVANYAAFFSPDFLFVSGDPRRRHAVPGHGELYAFFGPLVLIGIATVVARRERALWLPLWWLLLYPVTPALMTEIPSASRGFIGAAAFCLMAGVGGATLLRWPERVARRPLVARALQVALVLASAAVLASEVDWYWRLYSEEYPRYAAKFYTGFQYGKREVVEYFAAHQDDYDQMVLTTSLSNQPQIFPLFYERFPPAAFQADGLAALRRDAKISIGPPERLDLYDEYPRLLFAVRERELPLFADYQIKRTVRAPDGAVVFHIIAVGALKDFVHQWEITRPFAADADVPAPAFRPVDPAEADDTAELRWYALANAAVAVNEFFRFEVDAAATSCVWAVNQLLSDAERPVTVFAGFYESGQVWINGERVETEWHYDDPAIIPDSEMGHAALREGTNRVAVKSCGRRDYWRFYFRLEDPDGGPVDGIQWEEPG